MQGKLPAHLLELAIREHFPLLVSGRLNSSTAPDQSVALASLFRHAKFLEKIGKSTWRLIMKYFIKWKIEEEISVDDVVDKKNRMWVTRPCKSTDPIVAAEIVITKLKEGNAFVPWQVWLGDVPSTTTAYMANVSLQFIYMFR